MRKYLCFWKAHPNSGKPNPFLSNQMGPITDYVGMVYFMSQDVLMVPQVVCLQEGFWSRYLISDKLLEQSEVIRSQGIDNYKIAEV